MRRALKIVGGIALGYAVVDLIAVGTSYAIGMFMKEACPDEYVSITNKVMDYRYNRPENTTTLDRMLWGDIFPLVFH